MGCKDFSASGVFTMSGQASEILKNRDLSQLMRQSENSTFGTAQHCSIEKSSLVADLDLIQRVNSNQPGAIEELIEQHGSHLQRLIASLSGGSSMKDDLMQETLLKAWNSASTYRGNAPLRHWLTQIAIRVCRNHQRGYRRLMRHLKLFWEQQTEQPCDAPTSVTADDEMQRAMGQLAYSDRELLVLYYYEDQSMRDIATQLDVKESTLHVRLHRSRERLKKLLTTIRELP